MDTLVPDESMTCTAVGTAIAGQYDNLGTAVATDPEGNVAADTDPSHYFGAEINTCISGADVGTCIRGKCAGGENDKGSCETDEDCPPLTCQTHDDCRDACAGGGRNAKPCNQNSRNCKPGCVGGARDGKVCKTAAQCPAACAGGDRDGEPCFNHMDCPGDPAGECGTAGVCEDSQGCVDFGECLASPSGAFLDVTGSLVD